jgi:hypothetical protein
VSYRVWRAWRGLGRTVTPAEILEHPAWLIDDILTLEGAYNALEWHTRKEK